MDQPKTFDELLNRILAVLPDAIAEEDNEGQIVIYTGLREVDVDGKLEPFAPADD